MKFMKWFWIKILLLCLLISSSNLNGQGIGDNLAFQGMMSHNAMSGVKARALGNAYTAVSGDLNAIFYNPAGLADINSFQFSFSGRKSEMKTFERQQFIPVSGSYGIMELIWAGIYIPQLNDDGIRSDKIKYDHAHFVTADSAVEYFDEKFADWKKSENLKGLNNIVIAYPFAAFDYKIVASASYTNSSIFEYDRNEHVLGTDYGLGRVIADSNWYIYNRQRSGTINNIIGAFGTKINNNLNVGLSFDYMWGNTDDELSNEIFAHMQITQQQNPNRQLINNTYYFWHDSTAYGVSGKSEFSYLKLGLGAVYTTNKVAFGLRINLPYSLKRIHNYQEYKIIESLRDSTFSPIVEFGNQINGESEFNAPFTLAAGISVKPVDFVIINVDYKFNPFSSGSYNYSSYDSAKSKWASTYLPNLKSFKSIVKESPDLNSFNAGAELKPFKFISFLAGYSLIIEDVRAEDHYKVEKVGTSASVYSAGLSINLPYVVLDFAYEWKSYNYIDYYSYHTDYITWQNQSFYSSITINL